MAVPYGNGMRSDTERPSANTVGWSSTRPRTHPVILAPAAVASLELAQLVLQGLQVDPLGILRHCPQAAPEAGVVEDGAGQEIAGRGHPHGSSAHRLGVALQHVGQVLARSAGDAYTVRVGAHTVVAAKPRGEAGTQNGVSVGVPVLQQRGRLRLVAEDASAGGRDSTGREEAGGGPASHEVDGRGGRSHAGCDDWQDAPRFLDVKDAVCPVDRGQESRTAVPGCSYSGCIVGMGLLIGNVEVMHDLQTP